MAADNLLPQERLNKIAQIINKGIYLCYQKTNGKIEEPSQEKETVFISKIKQKEHPNGEHKIYVDEKILTVVETMEFLKVSRTTLWRLRKCTELPYCRIGNRKLIRFRLSEILNYVETKRLDRKV